MSRDLDHLREALRRYLDVGDRLTRVVALSTGHSNETYLLEGVDLIMRTPPSADGLLPPYDMARQHAVFSALHETPGAPPVPKPVRLCLDSSVIGDPFFLMERVHGEAWEYEVPAWLSEGGVHVQSEACRQWISAVAAVDVLPPLECLGAPRSPADESARWRDVALGADAPSLAELLSELVDEPGEPSGPPTLVWGDSKMANVLWSSEGKLLAIVDWELAYNGESLGDLGYALMWFPPDPEEPRQAGFDLPGMWSRQQVISTWEQLTGRSAGNVARHEAAAIAKIGAILAVGAKLASEGRSQDPRLAAWIGAEPYMVQWARNRLEAHAR